MTVTKVRMPKPGAVVRAWAYCRGCGSELGYWHFVWDDEPRTFTSHVCPGHADDTVFELQWREAGEEP